MEDERDVMASLALELRRGTLVLSVLSQLRESRYGYALVQKLESWGCRSIPAPCIPCCGVWKTQGLLASVWDTSDSKPRKSSIGAPRTATPYMSSFGPNGGRWPRNSTACWRRKRHDGNNQSGPLIDRYIYDVVPPAQRPERRNRTRAACPHRRYAGRGRGGIRGRGCSAKPQEARRPGAPIPGIRALRGGAGELRDPGSCSRSC